jgi:hypothetical protein
MWAGKDLQRTTGIVATDPIVQDESQASGSSTTQPGVSSQPPVMNVEQEQPRRESPTPQSEVFQNVLIGCNSLIEEYRKRKISKPTVYSNIWAKLTEALGDDQAKIDTAFRSFITTVESHDSETEMAARRGAVANREH